MVGCKGSSIAFRFLRVTSASFLHQSQKTLKQTLFKRFIGFLRLLDIISEVEMKIARYMLSFFLFTWLVFRSLDVLSTMQSWKFNASVCTC